MGSPSALKRPINSSSPRPDAVPPFEQEQRPESLTPSPDLMSRQHTKRRARFMNHTSTLKTFSEKDEELERRTPKALPKCIIVDSSLSSSTQTVSIHPYIIFLAISIQIIIAILHGLVVFSKKREIDTEYYMILFKNVNRNPESLKHAFNNCTYFGGPHLFDPRVFMDYDISVYASEIFFPFTLTFHLMVMMSRPTEDFGWFEAVIAVTFVMAKVRVRMRQLDHRKMTKLVFNTLPATMITLVATLAFLSSDSLGCLMRYSCLDVRLCEDKIYSGATFCYLFYTLAFINVFTLPLRREYGLQNLMRFDFAHFIEQVEFYALFYAGLIGMFAFASCNEINNYDYYYNNYGKNNNSLDLDQNFWFRGLLYYSSSMLLLFVILFSWFDISHLHIKVKKVKKLGFNVSHTLHDMGDKMKSMRAMKSMRTIKSTNTIMPAKSMPFMEEGDKNEGDNDHHDDPHFYMEHHMEVPPPPDTPRHLSRSSSSALRSSFTGQEDAWFEHKVKEGPKKGRSYYHQPRTNTTTWIKPANVDVKCGVVVKKHLIPAAPMEAHLGDDDEPEVLDEMHTHKVMHHMAWTYRIRHNLMTHVRGRWAPIHRMVMLIFCILFFVPTPYYCFHYMPMFSTEGIADEGELKERQTKLQDAYDVVSFCSVLLAGSTCMYSVTHPFKTFDIRKNWAGVMFFLPTISFYMLAYSNFGSNMGYDNTASVLANISSGTLWIFFYKRFYFFIKAVRMLNVQEVDNYLANVATWCSRFMIPAIYLTSESVGCMVSEGSGVCQRLLRCNYGIVLHLVLAFVFECICSVHHKQLNFANFMSLRERDPMTYVRVVCQVICHVMSMVIFGMRPRNAGDFEAYPFGLSNDGTERERDPLITMVEGLRIVIPVMWVGLIGFEVLRQHNFIVDIEHFSRYLDERVSEDNTDFDPIQHGWLYFFSHHLFECLENFLKFFFVRFVVPRNSPRISNIFSMWTILIIFGCFLFNIWGWVYAVNDFGLGTNMKGVIMIKFGLLLTNLFIIFFILLLLFTDLESFETKKASKRFFEAVSMHHLRKYIIPALPAISGFVHIYFINLGNVVKVSYPGNGKVPVQDTGDSIPGTSLEIVGLYEYLPIPVASMVIAVVLIHWRKDLIKAFPADILKHHILAVVMPTLLAVVPTLIYMGTEYLACNIRLNDIYAENINNYTLERPAYVEPGWNITNNIGNERDFIYQDIACGRLFYSLAPVMYLLVGSASCSFMRVGKFSTNIDFEKMLTLKDVSIFDGIQMIILCTLVLYAIMMYGTRRLGESVQFQQTGWSFIFIPLLVVYIGFEARNSNLVLKRAMRERELQEDNEEDEFEAGIRDSYAKENGCSKSAARMSSRGSTFSRSTEDGHGSLNIELRKSHANISIWDGGGKGAFKARKSTMGWANGASHSGGDERESGFGESLGGGEDGLKGEGILLQLNPGMI
ncbi:hypothetical protein TL16_g09645 [Triparma laevis f. inornata]|uniref:WW domain-containing protein n=1 Tax=Triparma laevis f. inornata TaxID=1714386 RepID=A0A9W7B472_9STRA|nr:hypothetical protein TL16_g09645 [Triparma laevis f. inornata]